MENTHIQNNSTDDSRLMITRLFLLLIIIMVGAIVGGGLSLLIGTDVMSIAEERSLDLGERNQVRLVALVNQAFMFLLPGIAFGLLVYKSKAWQYLRLHSRNIQFVLYGILMILAAIPLVSFTNYLNHLIPLPEMFSIMEERTQALVLQLLTMNNIGELTLNFILIGIFPGIGEELIFRGILQSELERFSKKPWLSITIAAIVFSAIHFQFAGFIPRMLLGMLLGFLYWRTRNLWVPIITHIAYNSFQVLVAFFYKDMLIEAQQNHSEAPSFWSVLLGAVVMCAIGYTIWQQTSGNELEEQEELNEQISNEI